MAKPKNMTAEEIIVNVNTTFIGGVHVQNNTKKEEIVNADPQFS